MKKKKLSYIPHDFTADQLPQTRKSQFFDTIKIRYGTLFKTGLVILVFCLLLIMANFFAGYFNDSITAAIKDGTVSESDGEGARKILFIISSAVYIVLYPLAMIGISGSYRIFRQLCFSEGIIYWLDYKRGIKDNVKLFVLFGLIIGVTQTIATAALIFLPATFISIFFFVFSILIVLPIIAIATFYSTIYINSFWKTIYHSAFLYLKSSWKILIFIVALFGPFVLLEFCVNLSIIKTLIFALLIVFYLPLCLLGGYELLLYQFDICFNNKHCPELVKKGLYKPDLDSNTK